MTSLFRNVYHKSRFYNWALRGPVPDRLRGVPPDPLSGDADAGRRLLDGNYRVFGHNRHLGDLPWHNRAIDAATEAWLHRFDFLRDLRAVGSPEAAARGRELMTRWGNRFRRWHETGWQPGVTGARITNWLCAFHFVNDDSRPGFGLSVREQLAHQARHLARHQVHHRGFPEDADAFGIAEGLILAGICLVGLEAMIDDGLAALEQAVNHQLLADGGHIQRNPTTQLAVLATLVRVRDTMQRARLQAPVWLVEAIRRAVPVMRMLCHGDGDVALFNGANEGSATDVRSLLRTSRVKGRALLHAPHTGFQRFEAPGAVVIADAGARQDAHAGVLSFEFSRRRQRVIVNCGANPERTGHWHEALRTTAAHSAMVVDDTNALETRTIGSRPVPAPPDDRQTPHATTRVACRRSDEGGSGYTQMRHNGYRHRFGLIHSRDLYLSSTGEDLRGRDSLNLSGDEVLRPAERFTIRFHLHPEIAAEATGGGDQVMLRLPNREGWRFRCMGGHVSVTDSVYVGRPATPRRSRQIVVEGPVSPLGIEVKWSFLLDRKGVR